MIDVPAVLAGLGSGFDAADPDPWGGANLAAVTGCSIGGCDRTVLVDLSDAWPPQGWTRRAGYYYCNRHRNR